MFTEESSKRIAKRTRFQRAPRLVLRPNCRWNLPGTAYLGEMIFQDHRNSFSRELSATSKHKLSFSNSSFVSSESPLSECHSRLSSVASVSGISSSGMPIMETPLVYSERLEAQSPLLGREITKQRPSPPLTEESLAVTQYQPSSTGHTSISRPDAVVNLQRAGQPIVIYEVLRSELTARPKYHKRATSAPLLASRTTTSASDMLPDHYPVSFSAQSVMDESTAKRRLDQAEDRKATMTATYQDLDSSLRNGHANAAVGPLPACGGALQSQEHDLNQTSDIHPLAKLARDVIGETALEVSNPESTVPIEEEPRCMFVDDCQTGSQLRKAISHLFGRNKACTLRIPKQVWVYYCRKHYQRVRYRNAKTYPLNQMYLVKMQINRLQRWSDENQRQGAGPYIKLWTLALRKREQSRLDKEGGAVEEGDDESLEAPNNSAAPDWIIQRLGSGYTTEQILEVADRLYREIENGALGQVPEVEFLPDITEPDTGDMMRPVKTRKQARTTTIVTEIKISKRRIPDDSGSIEQGRSSPLMQHDGAESATLSRKRVRLSPLGIDYHEHPELPLPSVAVPLYANNAPSSGLLSSVPRTLPAIPRMQLPSSGHSQGLVAHMYGLSSSEHRRPTSLSSFYDHDYQQHSAQYRAGTESLFQRNREHHQQQRLPPIAHLTGASDPIYHSTTAIPSYRSSWTSINDDPNMPRPPRLRSYSDNIPTSQPMLGHPRPSSSGESQPSLTYFDDRVAATSTHGPNTGGYPREHWLESGRGYAPGWPQRSGVQQPYHYYDQVTRPQLDSLRAPANVGLSFLMRERESELPLAVTAATHFR
ncbi:hypothetical protein V8C35DRAFT_320907 [Trichoderma chlorosporum]